MVRKFDKRTRGEREVWGGPGIAKNTCITENNEELNNKGRLFNHVYLEPGVAVGNHTHVGDSEIYYILKGSGEYNDNGKIVTVAPGDVTICYNGEEHGLLNTGDETLEMVALILFA